MKRRSIKSKFFFAISAVALVFIGVLIALNLFFYDDYYLMTRKADLRESYQSVRANYTGDIDDIATRLDALENRNAIRLAIIGADGSVKYASAFAPESERHASLNGEKGDALSPVPPHYQLFDPSSTFPFFGLSDQQFRSFSVLLSVINQMDEQAIAQTGYQFLTVMPHGNEQYLCLAGAIGPSRAECLIAYMPYAFIEQNSSFNLVFLLIAGGCALLICLVCAYFLSRQFTRPLIEMGGVANSMARLDFSQKYEGSGSDEIGDLGQSLNRLSSYLEQAIGELQQSNAQLAQEIQEKERIDNMRREFIVNVSHELKTPIALIQGYAEGLTAGVADDPEDRKYYCDTIADEADHMNKLVMQLLSLSKLELGAEQTYFDDVDLHALCGEAVRKTALLCESRSLSVGYDNTHAAVHTDGGLIEQVLMNYLSNAIRYTVEGGHIELSAVPAGAGVRLSVFNEGDGLPEEELPKIWEKFYRTDHARTREAGGTGIGLSLVRAIADMLGGACGAENTAGGIVFWFDIPHALPADGKDAETVE